MEKIRFIKELRAAFGFGLKHSKEITEGAMRAGIVDVMNPLPGAFRLSRMVSNALENDFTEEEIVFWFRMM